MRIQGVSNSYQNGKSNLSFKNKLIFDIGASDPRGSLKILVQDNNNKDLFEYRGFLNDTTQGFKDNNDFIKKVAGKADIELLLKEDISEIENKLKWHSLSPEDRLNLESKLENLKVKQDILKQQSKEEKKLSGLVLLLPGTIQGSTALFMANLRKTDKTSLTNVPLGQIVHEINRKEDVELTENFKFIPCKDLAGTGLGVAHKIANHPDYKHRFTKGFYAVAVQTGGGFGAVDIKLENDAEVDIETNESSHDRFHDAKTSSEKRLGHMGASVASILKNFANELGVSNEEQVKALQKTGLAQIATQYSIRLNKTKDKEAIQVLLDTGCYKKDHETLNFLTLKVKDKSLYKFNKASEKVVNAYADTISIHAITKINKGANLYILSGPLAMGLNETIKERPEIYGANDLRELVFKKINSRVWDDITCNILMKAHDFDVVCDKSLSVDNNTPGGALLLADNTTTFARRGEWLRIPKKVLKE